MIYPGGYVNPPSLKKKTTTTYEYDSEGKIVKETVVEEEYGYSYSGYTSGTEIKIGTGEDRIVAGKLPDAKLAGGYLTPQQARDIVIRGKSTEED